MSDPVLQTVELDMRWPTVDPFLFCVHHLDRYPAADGTFGPAASLEGRDIGQDFAGVDGWNMYHGTKVPGFPQHPHRGFETVTFARRGYIDHSDSLGARARFGRGDVQWMTAGAGIVHSEMFPLFDEGGPNTTELFQIWINLPAEDKLVEPHFSMLWDEEIPRLHATDSSGGATEVTVIAGPLDGLVPPAPPPHSWASRPEADVAIWHVVMATGAQWDLPAARGADTVRTVYVFEGDELRIGDRNVAASTGAVVDAARPVTLTAGASDVELLVLQGVPIGEPVAQYGPFVMNSQAEIRQAMIDYQQTGFGGWPWPVDDPVHGHDQTRFAVHADGRLEESTVSQ